MSLPATREERDIVAETMRTILSEDIVTAPALKAAQDVLVARHGIHMDPGTLRTALKAAFLQRDDELQELRETERARLDEAYAAGKRRVYAKHRQLGGVVEDLRAARGMVESCLAWTGPEEYKQATLARLDQAIKRYTP